MVLLFEYAFLFFFLFIFIFLFRLKWILAGRYILTAVGYPPHMLKLLQLLLGW